MRGFIDPVSPTAGEPLYIFGSGPRLGAVARVMVLFRWPIVGLDFFTLVAI